MHVINNEFHDLNLLFDQQSSIHLQKYDDVNIDEMIVFSDHTRG